MRSKRARLDRFLCSKVGISRRSVRPLLAQGRVLVDGVLATDINQLVDEFTSVKLDAQLLQNKRPRYVMLHKPVGVVSATKDDKHKTVIDLLTQQGSDDCSDLHIVGRLDFNTSGLLLLTNDGRWSRRLTQPESKVAKHYRVTLEDPITPAYIDAFAEGMYFPYEDITTRPAELKIIGERVAEVSLVEGRYHQIKRMFGRFRNRVVALHRHSIGDLSLGDDLAEGQSRELADSEIDGIG